MDIKILLSCLTFLALTKYAGTQSKFVLAFESLRLV